MRTSKLHAVLAAVAIVGIACPGPDDITAPVSAWTVVLTGLNEVPPPNPASVGAGTASFSLGANGTSLTYTINLSALPASAITQAHLHQGAAGANAAIAIWMCGTAALPGPAGTPTCAAAVGVLATGTVTVSSAQLTAMRAFGMYLNVHTATNAGGEMRGQLLIVPPPAGE